MSRRREARKTAAELAAELAQDRSFVAQQEKQEAMRNALEAELAAAESPLVLALNSVGVRVASVWDLVNTAVPYPSAIPVLLAHASLPYPKRIREGIIRALTVVEARRLAASPLIQAFRDEPDQDIKWVIGNALATVGDETRVPEFLELAKNSSHGDARQMLLQALRKVNSASARIALLELTRSDRDLARLAEGIPGLKKYLRRLEETDGRKEKRTQLVSGSR
jgi:hypothetical protein